MLLHKRHHVDFLNPNIEHSTKPRRVNFLHKYHGANPYNVFLISGMLTSLSVVIAWIMEWIANGILLQY